MHLTHLEVLGFRNVSRADVDLSSGINLLVGENGAGKTAILEAIYLLARGRSFRTTQSKQLIRHGDDELVVRAEVDTGQILSLLMTNVLQLYKMRQQEEIAQCTWPEIPLLKGVDLFNLKLNPEIESKQVQEEKVVWDRARFNKNQLHLQKLQMNHLE